MQPDEKLAQFKARINKAAVQEGIAGTAYGSDSEEWLIGSNMRDVGSVHSDTWMGKASNLARRGAIAVHPVGGWWKERKKLERWTSVARFALVITIDASEIDVELYNSVAVAAKATATVET